MGFSIGRKLKAGDIVTLEGDLGAGKTTLVKGIARALDIHEEITSPSFTLISEYTGMLPLYHMDLYRIQDEEEFYNLGIEELLYAKGISIIEWGAKADFLPENRIRIDITIGSDGTRTIRISGLTL